MGAGDPNSGPCSWPLTDDLIDLFVLHLSLYHPPTGPANHVPTQSPTFPSNRLCAYPFSHISKPPYLYPSTHPPTIYSSIHTPTHHSFICPPPTIYLSIHTHPPTFYLSIPATNSNLTTFSAIQVFITHSLPACYPFFLASIQLLFTESGLEAHKGKGNECEDTVAILAGR